MEDGGIMRIIVHGLGGPPQLQVVLELFQVRKSQAECHRYYDMIAAISGGTGVDLADSSVHATVISAHQGTCRSCGAYKAKP